MATKICDTEPCDRMKVALKRIFVIDQPYDPEKGLLKAIFQKKGAGGLQEMNLKYCPFCGTRVALGLIDRLEESIGGGRVVRTSA